MQLQLYKYLWDQLTDSGRDPKLAAENGVEPELLMRDLMLDPLSTFSSALREQLQVAISSLPFACNVPHTRLFYRLQVWAG
jgi:hypothetical protein